MTVDIHSLMVPLSLQKGAEPSVIKPEVSAAQKRGRKKVYGSPAERQAAYRARKKEGKA